MRVKNVKTDIDYNMTKDFFRKRAQKYNNMNPYSVTMYQDNNPELVYKRNQFEKEKLIGYLNLDKNSKVLDLACGIGRWADATKAIVGSYLGVDFSEELISIARQRNNCSNVSFAVGSSVELDTLLKDSRLFNRVLIFGLFMYLNDRDVITTSCLVEKFCEPETIICIREPIGIDARLTVKNHFSDELQEIYNAVYRTRDQLIVLIKPAFLDKGFDIVKEDFLFNDVNLNNRKETAQYYFILKRKKH